MKNNTKTDEVIITAHTACMHTNTKHEQLFPLVFKLYTSTKQVFFQLLSFNLYEVIQLCRYILLYRPFHQTRAGTPR